MADRVEPTRRDFLRIACGAAVVALGPSLLAGEAAAADGIKRKRNGQVAVRVAMVPGLSRVGGMVLLGTVRGIPVAVVRTGRRRYRALDLRCTHQGTTVRPSRGEWLCPNHGSRFNLDGALAEGPAKRALSSVRSSLRRGILTVG